MEERNAADKVFERHWQSLYLVLAALILGITVYTLLMNHLDLAQNIEVVRANEQLNAFDDQITELRLAAQAIDAPGNDVFDAQDPASEITKAQKAESALRNKLQQAHESILKFAETKIRNQLFNSIEGFAAEVQLMFGESNELFEAFQEGDRTLAAAKMAAMDRHYALALKSLDASSAAIRAAEQQILRTQLARLEASNQWESVAAIGIIFLLVGIIIYSQRMMNMVKQTLKKMTRSQKVIDALEQAAIVAYTDHRGIITSVNEKFTEISGYSRKELVGQTHRMVRSGAHPREYYEQMWQTIASGKVWTGEFENRAKDGRHYYVNSIIIPLDDPKLRERSYMAVRFDVSAQRLLEAQLEKEKLKALRNAKLASLGELAAGVAHEINNPLAIIAGNIYALSSSQQELPQATEEDLLRFKAMDDACRRIQKIVRSLRKFSRTDEKEPHSILSIQSVVEEAVVLTRPFLRAREIEIKLDLATGLAILGNEMELEQVLINLIQNAAYAIQDQEQKWIQISAFLRNASLVLQVRDAGPRIPDDIAAKIFEPFFTTKPVGEGTGLGLAIVKGILDEHHATIEVLREDPHTCFEMVFPLAE